MKALQQLFGSSSGSRIEAIESKSNRESPPPGLTDISNTTTPSPSSKYTMGSTDRSVAVAPPLLLNEQHDSTTSPLQQSSYRSEASAGSSVNIYSNRNNSTTATSATVKAQKLHSNLMRCQIRDPYNIYIVIRELGSGSMGSVQMVQKKTAAMGGSARKEFVVSMAIKPTKQIECCQCGPLLNNLSERMVKLLPGQKQNLVEAMPIPNPKTLFHQTSSLVDYSRDPIKQSTQYYALKSLHLNQCANAQLQKELRNEVAILKTLDHPHIARALETFEFQGSLYICLELCSGGDLYFRDPYTEYEAAQILYSLTSSVRYLHLHDIIHRDLKFENCMFASCDSPVEDVKLIDFGLSKKFTPESNMKDTVGTVYTMAPELLAGNYNEKADIWSLGVMAFMLLSSSMPFYGKDRSEVIKRICRGKIHFKAKGWNNKSDVCKHLVLTLLNKHVDERPTSEEALNMIKEWRDSCEEARDVSNSEPPLQISNDSSGVKSNYYHGASERSCNTADTGTSSHMSNSSASYNSSSKHYNKSHAAHNMLRIQASIHAFAQYNMLKKLALMIIAYKSTSSEIGFLRHMFQTYFDVYQNGQICLEEFATALQPFFNYTPDEVEALFQGMDVDGSGIVHYTEFLAATIESHGSISEDRLADAFDRMDCDDSGYITLENLRDFLGDDVPLEYLETIVKEADILKDKRINYEEFLQLWNVGCDQVLDDAKDDVLKRQKQAGSYARNFQWSSSSRVEESSNENYVVALKDDSVVQEQSTGQRQQQQLPDCMKTPTINNISSQVDAVQCFKKQKALSVRNSW